MSNWQGLIDPTQKELGIVLELWDTGGGCTALQAFLEGDVTVCVTDSPSSPNGSECQITGERERRLLGEENVGFFIGVYRDEGSTMVTYLDVPHGSITDLPRLIKTALDMAVGTAGKAFTAAMQVTIPAPGKEA